MVYFGSSHDDKVLAEDTCLHRDSTIIKWRHKSPAASGFLVMGRYTVYVKGTADFLKKKFV